MCITDRWKVPPKSSASTASANDNEEHFQRDILIVRACKTNVFYWTLLLYTLAANKHSFHRARPCGIMNSLAGNRDNAFV